MTASRYATLLPTQVRERLLIDIPAEWSEIELQAHWFAGDFGRDFRTVDGRAVRIVQFGVWNREAGPDFNDAAISINGEPALGGPIEFDPEARDWERHGHATNPAYEDVVLHVFTRRSGPEFFTRTLGHRNVPQVLLDVASLPGTTPAALPEAKLGRCCAPLSEMPEAKVRDILRAAAQHRWQRKAAALARLREAHGEDEALYQSLAGALGYKSNKLPFSLLAQRLPLSLLLKEKDGADSLLFGVSGFLPGDDWQKFDPVTKAYLRELWERWWQRRAEFARLTIGPDLWNLGGQRPANHPQRRLAALARLVRRWSEVRKIAARGDVTATREFFASLHD